VSRMEISILRILLRILDLILDINMMNGVWLDRYLKTSLYTTLLYVYPASLRNSKYRICNIYSHRVCFTGVTNKCLLTGVKGSLPFKTASIFLIDSSSNPICLQKISNKIQHGL
jgi:hypothetical protein